MPSSASKNTLQLKNRVSLLNHSATILLVGALCVRDRFSFFFNDTATTEIYTLSLHDALPISPRPRAAVGMAAGSLNGSSKNPPHSASPRDPSASARSEEHTSELQSHLNL